MAVCVDGNRFVAAGQRLFVSPKPGKSLATVAPRVEVIGFLSKRLVKRGNGVQRLRQPQLGRAEVHESRDAPRQQFERGFEGTFCLLEASGFEVPQALQEEMLGLFK